MTTRKQFEEAVEVIQAALREKLVIDDLYQPTGVDQVYINSHTACPINYSSDIDFGGWTVCDSRKLCIRTEADVLKEQLDQAEKEHKENLSKVSTANILSSHSATKVEELKMKLAQLGKYP